eukprot:CAMPEP_0195535220 /NCGR_PEP_ID=MMETSP0794_2-20130614/43864_1 /TAXON_ID=515487 /ORGANISM="Stephanopyxis turris, Strain CCMP 815" /LENGTH=61 /DNA_ID=CAMNT_0040668297 /DNA_START=117 /DNA_END=302 /DNA_ORIENTATION=+
MVFQGQDAWRNHPIFKNAWKSPLPGFKYAVAVYGTYYLFDTGLKSLMAPKPSNVNTAAGGH